MSRRLRAAGAVVLAVSLACCGCAEITGVRNAAAVTDAEGAADLAATSRQINELEQAKRSLEAEIGSASWATGPAPANAGAQTSSEPAVTPAARHVAAAGAVTSSVPSLAVDFAALERALSGASGIAIAPVGHADRVVSRGTLTNGVAWSTIKVPLAVAAVRADGGHPSGPTSRLIQRAITRSDNAAAESLWARLGSSSAAAAAVGAVLRDAGDATTRVQARRVRDGFTPFGQTMWPLAAQARVAANLPCLSGASPIVTAMGHITQGQRWGLGRLGAGARFKGGWGPGPDGRYLARQFGVVPLPQGGLIAVAIASRPADGSFATATAHLDAIVAWLRQQMPALSGGHC